MCIISCLIDVIIPLRWL